jgi:NodT family efflux transporter outer membrane factor (OMF) lipoprotein
MKRVCLSAGLAALLLAGCAGRRGPPLVDAAVPVPDQWRTMPDTTAPSDPYWWRQLGDPVLTGLVEQAIASNLDLRMAAARVAEARAAERIARAQLLPAVSAAVDAARSRSVGTTGSGLEQSSAQPVFEASYEVDLFGRLRDSARAAHLGAEAAAAARDAVALSVAAAMASGYVSLRALDQRLLILEQTLASRADALRLARDRARAGYTSELEFRQAEADYEATAQLIPTARLAIATQENALSLLIGKPAQPIPRGLPLAALARPAVPAALPSQVVRQRPDIAQAEYLLAASDARLAAARADFMPKITLGASIGGVFASALPDPVGIWSLGGSILAPLFAGGRLSGQLGVAAAQRDQAALGYGRTVLTAFREVEDNLVRVRRYAEQRAHLATQRDALAAALMHAENRYRAGYSPYLDQLDAQRNLLGVELSVVQAEADQLVALIALHQATGGGWGSEGGETG